MILFSSVGIEADGEKVALVVKELAGKNLEEVIAAGTEKLGSVPSGGTHFCRSCMCINYLYGDTICTVLHCFAQVAQLQPPPLLLVVPRLLPLPPLLLLPRFDHPIERYFDRLFFI